jgi:hypothetical protein
LNVKRSKRLERIVADKQVHTRCRELSAGKLKQGIGKDVYFDSANEALEYSKQLVRDGRADLFRGQTVDWPRLLPSLLRPNSDVTESQKKLDAFLDWARSVPQMAMYRSSIPALTAIAQHYGIPTKYLDLTSNPEIAFLFAKGTEQAVYNKSESIVYCFLMSELAELKNTRIIQIDVANLWRLEAQSGLFLEYQGKSTGKLVKDSCIRVHFPRESIAHSETLRLYPTRKSALETVIDQWMYRHGVESILGSLPIPRKISIRRQTYPGVFKWRESPEFDLEWIAGESGWFVPPIEAAMVVSDLNVVVIPLFDVSDPFHAQNAISDVIKGPICEAHDSNGLLTFKIELSPGKQNLANSASNLMNKCWDGLRVLPYTFEEIVTSLSLIAALLVARAEEVAGVDDWPARLWGEVELIDIAPVGGHLESALVSTADLQAAFSARYKEQMVKWARNAVDANPRSLMDYVVDPWVLFDFKPLKRIFVEQFLPSAISSYWREDLQLYEGTLGCMWSLSFNPCLLGFVTESAYRFTSEFGLERNIEKTIYITPEMDVGDIEEAFISCMPSILAGSEPYEVKFTGYSRDDRELWEIERVLEQAGFILAIGGISVLEVFTSLRDEKNRPIQRKGRFRHREESNGALGALEVWLFGKRLFRDARGMNLDLRIKSEFWNDLMIANETLESRARACSDWPGTPQA